MSRKLIVNDGRRLRELLLVSKIVVGRDPTCDLSEADPLLSRRHAEFSVSGDDIVVRDLGSRNGIYINGARIAEGTLQSGDIVRVGHLQMQYVEDSTPLVSVPELMDDATGLVFPGPRSATPKPPSPSVVSARPAAASGAGPKPAAPAAASPRPAPAPPAENDGDVTSYVSPSAIRRQPPSRSASQPAPPAPPKPALPKPAPPNPDEVEQTRVVPAPGRTGLRPKVEPMRPAPGEHTSVQAPPPIAAPAPPAMHTAVTPPPMAHTAVQPPPAMHTVAQPPPAPPVEDLDEPTSVVLAPRPRTRIDPPPVAIPTRDTAREARALAMAVAAIRAFLASASISQPAADAVKTLERDLATAAPPADLVAALKGLAARLSAAANELT